mgnify:CR=1 FL=1
MNTVLINQIASRVKAQHTSVDSLWQNEQTAWQQLGKLAQQNERLALKGPLITLSD